MTKVIKCNTTLKDYKAVVRLDGYRDILFDFSSETISELINVDFALWAILPMMMRKKLSVDFQQPISRESLMSAQEIARIWTQWCPGFYHEPKISTPSSVLEPNPEKKTLTFFSGGIDSTFSAHKIFKTNGKDSDCLTVQGLDYPSDKNHGPFHELKEQTESFRNLVFDKSRFVRTNIYDFYADEERYCNPHGGHVTHIFALFSSASLFSKYSTYRISADYRLDQQYMVHPWGSNTATNRLMRNSNGVLETLDDEYSRIEKVKYLSDGDLNLSSLSFCGYHGGNVRPKNCGRCNKCTRTKAMFYASNKTLPNIFIDRKFNDDWHERIPLNQKMERAFCFDLLSFVRSRGLEKEFPGFAEAEEKLYNL